MKKDENKFSGELSLNKKTMASLNHDQQDNILGGSDSESDNLCTHGSCATTSYHISICISCVPVEPTPGG